MNRCLITYQDIPGNQIYSSTGLKKLSPRLHTLQLFPYSSLQQRQEAVSRATKISIQGVQPKLSARLNIAKGTFELVDTHGLYILKPTSLDYEELPANEDLTMKLASYVGIEVPFHGLIHCVDNSLTYFIRRFDRAPHHRKLAVEDFAQLAGLTRDTKYNASMELVVRILETYTTFPVVEKLKLFERVIFCFLIGNEDMHLKNFSLITRNNKVELSPAYDLVNTTAILTNPLEEIALPLRGKKNKLTHDDIFDYFALQRLALPSRLIEKTLKRFRNIQKEWEQLISISFLSSIMKERYQSILNARCRRLWTTEPD